MTRATNTTSAAPTLRSLLPSWRLFAAIFAGGLCAGAINGLALRSLGQKPRQPSTQQCASNTHDAAYRAADDGRLVRLAGSGLGLALQQAQLPLLLGQQPLGAVAGVLALPCSQLGIAVAPQCIGIEPRKVSPLLGLHEVTANVNALAVTTAKGEIAAEFRENSGPVYGALTGSTNVRGRL